MRVGVVGINHKLASVKLRETLAKACQKRFIPGGSMHGDHTCILLTTCNRTEIYFSSEELPETHGYLLQILRQEVDEEFDQKVYSYFGQDCFLHLSRVVAGLDSAIVAETEIQGQVKAAYLEAARYISLPGELHYLFQKALKIGKQVRSELMMGSGMPDIEHAIFQTGMHLFKYPEKAKILFVGASDINQKILSFLKGKKIPNITICNRSFNRSHAIAQKFQVNVLEWDHIKEWHQYNWIIFGTKAPDYLISKTDLKESCASHKLIIDLCIPRNVEPKLGRDPRITLMNIDQINRVLKVRKRRMTDTLVQAEAMVTASAKQYSVLFQEKERYRLKLHSVNAS